MRRFGELESVIMHRLWEHASPLTVRQMLDTLRPDRVLAYTTVLTVMDNLFKKGLLRRELVGRAFEYAPTMSEGEYGARQLRDVLDDAADPVGALVGLVGRMRADEAAALRRALEAYGDDDR